MSAYSSNKYEKPMNHKGKKQGRQGGEGGNKDRKKRNVNIDTFR